MRSPVSIDKPAAWRGIFCNRTLNLRSVKAIGYDMDYTLIHYQVAQWEQAAFEHARAKLIAKGWPLDQTAFDPTEMIRGLVVDLELGNVVKCNRFGYVKAASHGSSMLDYPEQRRCYARTPVDLGDERFIFLNTLFGLSEAAIYARMVDAFDRGQAPEAERVLTYRDLYTRVRQSVDETHVEGELKAEILADPERYVDVDLEVPLTLLDQRHAGKKVLLITNSGWPYANGIMEYAIGRHLPGGTKWRDLFDVNIVGARKPLFFTRKNPVFEIVNDDGLLRPLGVPTLEEGRAYLGGHAALVEESLGLKGEQILYVGDHAYGDVLASKSMRGWRTALVLRELEAELLAIAEFAERQDELSALMAEKGGIEEELSGIRIALQRRRLGYGPPLEATQAELESAIAERRSRVAELDDRIAPLAEASARLSNDRWGLLMRTGNDKSMMARHVERHADIYTSRVSNLLHATPFHYLRSSRGSLPHDV